MCRDEEAVVYAQFGNPTSLTRWVVRVRFNNPTSLTRVVVACRHLKLTGDEGRSSLTRETGRTELKEGGGCDHI